MDMKLDHARGFDPTPDCGAVQSARKRLLQRRADNVFVEMWSLA